MKEFLAPCGINCERCYTYLREKDPCLGCRAPTDKRKVHCANCDIANCVKKTDYCYECGEFPCKRVKDLDRRYRTKYGTELLNNLALIEKEGVEAFVAMQRKSYACRVCGSMTTVHGGYCVRCREREE